MKNLKSLFILFAFTAIAFSFTACGGESAEGEGKEYTSAYICPMHCEGSGSDQAGKCPVCKMDYVVNEKNKTEEDAQKGHEGHNHEGHDHDGHSH